MTLGIRRLTCEFLELCVKDATGRRMTTKAGITDIPKAIDPRDRNSAIRFIGSPDFDQACESVDIDPDAIRAKIATVQGEVAAA